MQLELSRFVESDLDDIAGYIAQDNPRRAVTFIQEIRAKLQEIGRNPLLYQLRPEIGAEARMETLGSYAILFWSPVTPCGSSASCTAAGIWQKFSVHNLHCT